MTENRVAYGRITRTADNVLYLIERGYMAALWTSDPELYALGAQAAFERLADPSAEVELIGDATLFCKNQGATFSGWVVKAGPRNSDPIRYKSTALELLGEMVAEQLAARGAVAVPPAYDYGVTITASMRHNVAVGAGDTSLCNRTMRHVISSAKYDPWSMVAGLPTCRPCANKAKAAGMVTRRHAAEILADAERAAARAVEAPVEAEQPAAVAPASPVEALLAAVERLDAAHVEAEQVLAEVAPAVAEAELAGEPLVDLVECGGHLVEIEVAPAAGSHMHFAKAAEAEAELAERPAPRPAELGDKLVHPRPAPVEACPSPVDASPAPALPQVDDSAPLGRRDLVTYNGIRYVIIRADSMAARARGEGQVELYPGNTLPDRISSGERGHWVEASACSRRLVLEWGVRHRDPVTGAPSVIAHAGRAFAEFGVEVGRALGERSAELVARAPGGEWVPVPVRTAAEREAEAARYLAALG